MIPEKARSGDSREAEAMLGSVPPKSQSPLAVTLRG